MSDRVNKFCDSLQSRLNDLEDRIESLRTSVRSAPKQAHDALHEQLDQVQQKVEAQKQAVAKVRSRVHDWANEKTAEVKATVHQWKVNREARKLAHRAERAEEYAATAIEVAVLSVDEAEQAVFEAITRAWMRMRWRLVAGEIRDRTGPSRAPGLPPGPLGQRLQTAGDQHQRSAPPFPRGAAARVSCRRRPSPAAWHWQRSWWPEPAVGGLPGARVSWPQAGGRAFRLGKRKRSRHTPCAVTGGRHTACACYHSGNLFIYADLSHEDASRHVHGRAGHVTRGVRRKEHHDLGNLLRLGDPVEWYAGKVRFCSRFPDPGDHLRHDHARRYGIDVDAFLGDFARTFGSAGLDPFH